MIFILILVKKKVKKNRIDYIDILKEIAIILVVYGYVLKNDNMLILLIKIIS